MTQPFRGWPDSSGHHPIELEHRLTVLEQILPDIKDLDNRVTALEASRPKWTPRDYLTAAAGVIMLIGFAAGKIALHEIPALLHGGP